MNAFETIKKIGVVPVVVLSDENFAEPLADALTQGGLPLAEITFRTAAAESVIARIKAHAPQMLVGAGTVLSAAQAERAINSGAEFIVSPGFNEKTARFCSDRKVPYFPGCVTPTEIMEAIACGITTVKFFPAESFGGLKTIKALSAPFGDVAFMPTGGVNEDNLAEYLSFSKVVACGGSWMVDKSDLQEGRFDKIRDKCRKAADIAAGVKR